MRIGDGELTPGFTAYRKRIQVQTFDVTDLIVEGLQRARCAAQRRLVARPARRRPRDRRLRPHDRVPRAAAHHVAQRRRAAVRHRRVPGGRPAATSSPPTSSAAKSTTTVVASQAGPSPAPIALAGIRPGRRARLRRAVPDDRSPGASHRGAPAVSVTELAPNRHIVDFGQNSNGWIRLDDLGPEGTELTIAYGEWLNPDGNLTQANAEFAGMAAPVRFHCRSRPTSSSPPATAPGSSRATRRRGSSTSASTATRGRSIRPPSRASSSTPISIASAVRVLRRAHQPPASRRRVELPRQRVRHPDRLPHPRAIRVGRRLAALHRHRRVPLRRR